MSSPLRPSSSPPADPARRPKVSQPLGPEWSGRLLIDAVTTYAGLDSEAALTLIVRGGAWLDRLRVQEPAALLAAGQLLTIHFPPLDDRPAAITAGDIVYEDAALLVLNKPPRTYVAPTPWSATGDILWATRRFLMLRDGTVPPLHLAHQLDYDTSGVLVLSKDPRVNGPLHSMFLHRTIRKRYLALVAGAPAWDHWEARSGHGRGMHGLWRIYPLDQVGALLADERGRAKLMETDFDVLERWPDATLLAAYPLTGRTHQIRLHLQWAGLPVAGDLRYGTTAELAGVGLSHHLLHAERLELPHPRGSGRLLLEAPPPPLFETVLVALRGRAPS